MLVLVVYDNHLLQICNELEKGSLGLRLLHLLFGLDQSLEEDWLDHRHQVLN
jgi:hypothetical protein